MSPAPEISVLVPCWNDGRYLDEALASIAAQSFRDFEAIVADDGSSDDSAAIAAAWAARDQRFRVVRGEHAGMTENWNRALAAARGRFVAKLDADDVWRPELLRTLHAELEAEPGRDAPLAAVPDGIEPALAAVPDGVEPALAAFCRAVECDEALSPIAAWHGEAAFAPAGLDVGARLALRGRDLWRLSLGEFQLWQSSAFLMRREDLLALGGFDERWSCAADTALLLRLFATERIVVHRPYVGVLYRRRPGSVSATFEASGWKSFEGILLRLDALARDARRLAPLGRELRQVWWQSWRSALAAAERPELWESMPATVRTKLERTFREARRPPAAVRLEGWLRLQAWRRRARSGARSSAERAA